METFTKAEALNLIVKAVESKAVTLGGSTGSGNMAIAKERAEQDAKYLLTLLNSLMKAPAG